MKNYGKIRSSFTIHVLLFIILSAGIASFAKTRPEDGMMMGGSITGQVYDSVLNVPIEYATIILFSQRDSSQVTGASTDETGTFYLAPIRPGQYYMQISFLGYELKNMDKIAVTRDNLTPNIGKILLLQSTQQIDGIRVESERPAMEYKIDKKVINVEKYYTASGGTAVDVLQNTPSVTVDLEGNVQLRGSSNFTVLIDGRPSILDANDALEQIPAGSIDDIELITNPSAKYDPDGNAGIINIILKKNKYSGTSAIVNSRSGFDNNYGGNIIVNYKTKVYDAYINTDYNKRGHPGSREENSWTISNDTTFYVNSAGSSDRNHDGLGFRGGIDFNVTSKDVIGIGFRYGNRDMGGGSTNYHTEWNSIDLVKTNYLSLNDEDRTGNFYTANFDFQHKFAKKNHVLSARVNFSRRDMDETQISETFDSNDLITYGQKTVESGPSDRWRVKIDYTLPINEKHNLEMGYQSRFGIADENNEQYDYDTLNGVYEYLPDYSYFTKYQRDIHALYAMYNGEAGKLGYQFGLRGEYTYRDITIDNGAQNFNIDRWDYFPTVHFSWKFDEHQQVMTNYARKIDRPRGWWLEPFETRTDPYNIRVGNPALKPEYTDSYEFGYQRSFGRNIISADLYYRVTHNKTDRIQTVYSENITLNSIDNVGTDYSFGTELMVNMTPFKFWELNLNGSVFHYQIEGAIEGEDFSNDDFNWNGRVNSTFKLGEKTRLQISGRYAGKSVSSQGSRKGFMMTDLALKHDFVPKVLTATLQVRDLFGSGKHEHISEGPDYYRFNLFEHKSPNVSLNLTYNFNNMKSKREGNGEDMGEDDF